MAQTDLTLDEVLAQLCEVVQAVTGWVAVQADQDGPTPKGSYLSLRITDVEVPVHDITSESDDPDAGHVETVRGQSYCTAEIIAHGPGAMDVARKMINGLQSASRQFDIYNTIGLGGFTGPQNLSESYGGQFRQRALVNMTFYANLSYTTAADYITNGTIRLVVPPIYDHTFTV